MSCRVFIGRLSPHAREKDVERFFKGYGRIREINLKNGFGFVEFEDHRDADDAVYELNGKELCNERVTIEYARSRSRGGWRRGGRIPPRFSYRRSRGNGGEGGEGRYGRPVRTEYRIIVENLSSRVSWQDLKDLMRQAGEVTFVDAHRNNKNEGTRSRSHSRSSSRSRSRSPSPRCSKSESRSRSRSHSKSRSASRSPDRKDQPSTNNRAHSRSKSPSGLTNQSRSRSRSVESAD
uniref:serine/arginine-rich splicing factor 5-like isoform X2 n=1 Tax=Pristiophorus japonicus TaxID=55135 RepID=UPI00398EFB2D